MQVVRIRQTRKFHYGGCIHSPGLAGLDKPIVWVFPELFLCLTCGKMEFIVPEKDLRTLMKDDSSSAG